MMAATVEAGMRTRGGKNNKNKSRSFQELCVFTYGSVMNEFLVQRSKKKAIERSKIPAHRISFFLMLRNISYSWELIVFSIPRTG